MSKIYGVDETIKETVEQFRLDRDGYPELIPTGFRALDEAIGGIGPDSCAILAAATGLGKSSAALHAMIRNTVKVGLVSLEDGADVVGTRLLAALTGIDSLLIRRKALTKAQLKKLNNVSTKAVQHMRFAYPLAGSIEQVEASILALRHDGCRLIIVDYIQEIRGHKDDRRNEVALALTRCHRAAASPEVSDDPPAALLAISQFHRMKDDQVPGIHNLAESGDLERKARVILLAHKQHSPDAGARIRFKLAKSTYGGEFCKFDLVRDPSGTLQEAVYYNTKEGF